MENTILAADEVFNVALQVLNERQVDATAIPLVAAAVAHRLEQFAIGAMAREIAELRKTPTESEDEADG